MADDDDLFERINRLSREEAKTLSKEIKAAAARVGNRDAQTRAHLIESAGTLDEALKAPLVRQGV